MKKLTDRDIIVDINKMKEIRRIFLSKSKEKRIRCLNLQNKVDKTLNIIVPVSLVFSIIFAASGIFWLLFINFILSYICIKTLDGIRKNSINLALESINASQVIDDAIDLFIDNNEAILENRKDKTISFDRIKNLNICFLVDERYDYDLKKINEKYNFDDDKLDFDVNSILTAEEFCEILEPIIGDDEKIKIKSKALICMNNK